ncbi:MAG: hypothetical protein A2V66_18035 [Ignavibacteria bacterium RBG_13_36_8]|nr:MAG: hypothetical protein A2V66_18035 [Ignavibacteria bacterium RBG_13_36_8]
MALRVKWLVQDQGVNPEAITVITFTAEAALNMRHRLSDEEKTDVYMPRDQQPSQISTMHSLGLQIISNNYQSLGLDEKFKVLDSDSLKRLLFEDSAQLAGALRSQGIAANDIKVHGIRINKEHELYKITQYYNTILKACNFIDFDDLILLSSVLLISNAVLRAQYQGRAKHLLVDEYQDINQSQYEFIRLLADKDSSGLFAVGDDDQSIYSFRGGSPEFVRRFKEDYGEKAQILEIPLCRRCPSAVLNGALSVVTTFNPERLPKVAPTFSSTVKTPIQMLSSPSDEKEASFIAGKCSRVTPSHDVLILVPHLSFAKPIIVALRQKRVAYNCRTILAEEGFFSLDVLGHWLSNPADNLALRQTIQFLIETDNFGVPSKRVRKAEKIAEREKYLAELASLWEVVIKEKCSLYEAVKINAPKSTFIANILSALDALVTGYATPASEFIDVLRKTFLPWGKSSDMFQEISTWIDEIKGRGVAGQGTVRIMSMRLAKGLEADYVFVVGLEENVFPRQESTTTKLSEASRLFFVSMTRAKLELYLCHSRTRSASHTYLPNSYALQPSPFLSVLPKDVINKIYLPADSKVKEKK